MPLPLPNTREISSRVTNQGRLGQRREVHNWTARDEYWELTDCRELQDTNSRLWCQRAGKPPERLSAR
jgi:hypothetical protein